MIVKHTNNKGFPSTALFTTRTTKDEIKAICEPIGRETAHRLVDDLNVRPSLIEKSTNIWDSPEYATIDIIAQNSLKKFLNNLVD
jgi:hypothetical protein